MDGYFLIIYPLLICQPHVSVKHYKNCKKFAVLVIRFRANKGWTWSPSRLPQSDRWKSCQTVTGQTRDTRQNIHVHSLLKLI